MTIIPDFLHDADGSRGRADADLLRKITASCAILAILTCIAGMIGNSTGSILLSSVCRGCKTLSLSAMLIWILFGAILVLLSVKQIGHTSRILLRSVLVVTACVECIEIAFSLNGAQFVVESWSVTAGSALFGPLSSPISPVASVLIVIAAAGLFFCIDPSVLSSSRLRAREITAMSGSILTLSGFTLALSYLFRTPLVLAKSIVPIAALSALAAFFIGLGLITATGPATSPICYFMGNSVRARLLRTFVSLIVAITLCETILFYAISAWLNISNEIMISASLVIFIVATSVIVGRVSEMIGQALDRKEQELADKNTDLSQLNRNLLSVEEKLRQTIGTLTRNEQDLHESGQFLRETEKIAKIGGWKANPQTDYLQWTDGVYDIFGAPRDHQPGFAESLNYFSPKDQLLIGESIETCLATGEPFTLELPITTGTKKEVWTEIRGLSPVSEGHLSFVIGTFQDISGRRQGEERLKRESGKLAILAESARLLMSSEKPEHVVQSIGERAMQFLSCHVFFNYLLDESGQRMELNAYAGIAPEDAEKIHYLNLGEAFCGQVARDGKRMVVSDILHSDDETTSLVRSFGVSGYACHPLVFQGRTLGTLSFGTCDRSPFTDEELDLMQAVTDLVATAMAQKRIADILRSTSQYLENLINYANAPIIVWDADYRILRFNHAFEFLTGMAADAVIGKPLDILFPEQSRRDSRELIRRTSGGVRWESVEIPILHVFGAVKIVLWNSANIYDADGTAIISTIAQGQDITERKNAEKTAKNTASLLRAALDSTADGIFVVDSARIITSYNKKFCAIWGIPEHALEDADEVTALAYMTPLVADTREFTDRRIELYNHPARESYDTVKLKDGRIFERYSMPQRIGDTIVGRVWSYRDITERRQAEISLQENLEKFRVIATSTPDHILVQDKDLRYTQVINSLPGLTVQDMIGKADHDILLREDADTLTKIKRQVLESGAAVHSEMSISSARGGKNFFNGSYVPTRNEAGEINGLIGYFRNVTEKRQANEKILAALAEKEILIREIHHRVKNNLQIITGLLDMTRMRARDPETTGILTDMMLKIKTMAQIHTRLYESHQSGQVRMGGQIQDMVTDLSGIYTKSAPAVISCEVDAEDFSLPVDLAIPCALVINEVLSNSFKHAFAGRRHGTIRVQVHQVDDRIHIRIRDDGTGIPEQVDPERTSSLGLKLIRNLVLQLRGTLAIENTGQVPG